jgi:hypothetical protein
MVEDETIRKEDVKELRGHGIGKVIYVATEKSSRIMTGVVTEY